MKILHTEASAGWGGQELRILAEMQGLRERGHVLELAAPASARIHREAAELGFRVHDVPIGRKAVRGIAAMRALLAREGYDLVNTHSSTDTWLTALANRLLRRPPPLVRTRHISAPVSRNRATRWLYDRACTAIVTTGETLRRELIEANGFTHVPIRSVPTGIDPARFQPGDPVRARAELGLPARTTVGILATLRSWKGHRFLVEAIGLLRGRGLDLQLLVVGDGPQREALEAQVAAAGLGDVVRFIGHDPRPERWLRALDLFVLPSYANEGVPQALMQAMMSGLPCITTDVGAIGEIAKPGSTAVLVPTQDSAALADAIERLLADPEQRRRLGASAREFALARCTRAAMCDAMEEVFADAIRRRGA
ncbi:glycosyltransferase family 4 protein [Ramlibacter sp.]|uniref:glycosyltransferase family 4 protein n=1 Tax=Ramlibacter sp. TaxID=1917967 RepID=UPI002D40B20C|nr:glycosyltransferase family 4 protein [Ramlibacter sp.]HYD75502.1 glycosyltransferase family 4 protein [Ramlibacter sp.]